MKLDNRYIYNIDKIDKNYLENLFKKYSITNLGGNYLQYTFSYGWAVMDSKPEISIVKYLK